MKNPIKYPLYKDSEVEWLHEIPSHWKIVKAKRIFHETSIKNHPDEPLLAATQTKGVIPKSLYENTTVTATKNFETLKFVRKGDFVISLRSFQGGIEYAHYQGIISPAYTILEPQEEVIHNYYRYLLKSKHYISGLTLLVTGIREGQNIDTGKFKDSFLPLPTKEEQTAIANFLNYKLSKIDRFIRKKKQLIKLLNEQKAAIINQAVTKGLDPNAKMKPSGIEWLGDIPEHWKVRKLKYLINGRLKYGANEPGGDFKENDPRYIRITDFDKSGRLRDDTFCSLNNVLAEPYLLKEGDVLFARSGGTVGKTFQFKNYNGIACYAGYLIKAEPNNLLMQSDYLFEYTNSRVYDSWKNFIFNKATIENIGADKYAQLPVIVPTLKEQTAIVSYIEKETAKINQTISTIEKEIALVEEYKTALIAEAVTGKIDVRDFEIPVTLEEESYENPDSYREEEELSMAAEESEDYQTIR